MRNDELQDGLDSLSHCIELGEARARRQRACLERCRNAGIDPAAGAEALRLTHEALDALYIRRALLIDALAQDDPHRHVWINRSHPTY
jgi:hypothetical protein